MNRIIRCARLDLGQATRFSGTRTTVPPVDHVAQGVRLKSGAGSWAALLAQSSATEEAARMT
ncbi:MAG: hypothetical protein IPH76_10490 [Xanthomonadales bacterium]|nr:hypothetical protein [Xanthomonadales bacterium]